MIQILTRDNKEDVKALWKENPKSMSIPFDEEINKVLDSNTYYGIYKDNELICMGGLRVMKRKPENRIIHLCSAAEDSVTVQIPRLISIGESRYSSISRTFRNTWFPFTSASSLRTSAVTVSFRSASSTRMLCAASFCSSFSGTNTTQSSASRTERSPSGASHLTVAGGSVSAGFCSSPGVRAHPLSITVRHSAVSRHPILFFIRLHLPAERLHGIRIRVPVRCAR